MEKKAKYIEKIFTHRYYLSKTLKKPVLIDFIYLTLMNTKERELIASELNQIFNTPLKYQRPRESAQRVRISQVKFERLMSKLIKHSKKSRA